MQSSETIETIRQYNTDIEETKRDLKTLKERAKEIRESTQEFDDLEESKEKMVAAKEALKAKLLTNEEYNNLLEKIADTNHKYKDQKEIMSVYVVEHYRVTRAQQIEIDENSGDARDIVVTGKLGKKGKFQTSLFKGDDDDAQAVS